VDARGARIAIESGTASFQVTPAKDRRWQVDVGPFLVTVKGTVFSVSWDAATERFELKLRRGRVIVSGPVNGKTTGGEIEVQAGQRLRVDLPGGETLISEQNPEGGRTRLRSPRCVLRTRLRTGRSGRRRPATPTAIAGGPRRSRPDTSTASSRKPSAPA